MRILIFLSVLFAANAFAQDDLFKAFLQSPNVLQTINENCPNGYIEMGKIETRSSWAYDTTVSAYPNLGDYIPAQAKRTCLKDIDAFMVYLNKQEVWNFTAESCDRVEGIRKSLIQIANRRTDNSIGEQAKDVLLKLNRQESLKCQSKPQSQSGEVGGAVQ